MHPLPHREERCGESSDGRGCQLRGRIGQFDVDNFDAPTGDLQAPKRFRSTIEPRLPENEV
jgi:hypothetical protein